ncbi:MAG TPA: DUF2062 domain-containing protein [Desulfobacteria bacterium]|nr:DUF2062 domain-containing protein [Desulfobacteria bacterium]
MVKRRLKYNLIKFLRLKGAPAKVALGFAIGACINFYPTFGLGVPLAGLAAAVFFANIPAGILGDITFKPLFPLFFYLNMITGSLLWPKQHIELRHLSETILKPSLSSLGQLGKVFFVGAAINSLILGTILYVFIYFVVERYRLSILKWLVNKNRRKN